MKIKKGDKVKVISGKDKGKSGIVVRALPRENKVVVEGIALYKRHLKGSQGKVGSIVERPRAIDVSNVVLVSSGTKIKSALDAK
ncbi:50S ribosomal protein L24 [Candidatus Kaiserbacteria bacterium GWA2_50_9]|uniref:Large ribosomal subunit protein uL24 n=1 Tax=Candidatus Kaiserbacteria bacterium GWA2_50_9 TaxID=1798474 RepID=A0A1F6BUG0_9BACT|nr:MAG: 50S ribosomal protein L24 [Candidatus Kaiserbacteria bacterium GWA2_50_9]